MQSNSCAFTGYRPFRFSFGYNEEHPDCIRIKEALRSIVRGMIDIGKTHFIAGMSLGTDTWAAEIVLELKKSYSNITLECALPCETQANNWTESQRKRYFDILSRCDKVTYISHRYTDTCMSERNRYMVDHSDTLIAVYDGIAGGTMETVNYAMSKRKIIIVVDPETASIRPLLLRLPRVDFIKERA